jgi:hypothetical protein
MLRSSGVPSGTAYSIASYQVTVSGTTGAAGTGVAVIKIREMRAAAPGEALLMSVERFHENVQGKAR